MRLTQPCMAASSESGNDGKAAGFPSSALSWLVAVFACLHVHSDGNRGGKTASENYPVESTTPES